MRRRASPGLVAEPAWAVWQIRGSPWRARRCQASGQRSTVQVLAALLVAERAGETVRGDADQVVEVERPHSDEPVITGRGELGPVRAEGDGDGPAVVPAEHESLGSAPGIPQPNRAVAVRGGDECSRPG